MEIKIGSRIANVELISKEDNLVKITIDDVLFELNIITTERGVFSILHNGRSYNAELTRDTNANGYSYMVNTFFSSIPVEILDPQSKYRQIRKKDNAGDSQSNIQSYMPGKVVKILVEEGQEVDAQQSVIVIEAMKMQNEYKVAADCTIKQILVKENENVSAGQVLITLDVKN